MSASADDAGYEFSCPKCRAALVVPAGDILFEGPRSDTHLLASHDAVGESFECPSCRARLRIPAQGQDVPVSDRVDPPSVPPAPAPQPAAPSAPRLEAEPPSRKDHARRNFMTAWGDYLAAAGLTEPDPTEEDPKT